MLTRSTTEKTVKKEAIFTNEIFGQIKIELSVKSHLPNKDLIDESHLSQSQGYFLSILRLDF